MRNLELFGSAFFAETGRGCTLDLTIFHDILDASKIKFGNVFFCGKWLTCEDPEVSEMRPTDNVENIIK